MKKQLFAVALSVFGLAFVCGVHAQSAVPITLQNIPIAGLSLPVFLTNAGDGSDRLFIVQQRGLIKVVQPRSTTATTFLDLTSIVSQSGSERGLLGLAFHPNYPDYPFFYVYYTRQVDGAIEIAEYRVSSTDPNTGDPTTGRVLLTIPHAAYANHNGGTIAFGPDGYLYAGTGDGGSGNDPQGNAQNINVLLGKILRINVNRSPGDSQPYNIPSTNPYAGSTPGADEIYAIGFRNPYRFSFDRAGGRQLWVGDVGQDAIEEVDTVRLGGNYGWRVYEGTRCTNNDPQLCVPANYIPPVFEYSSAAPDPRCAVTGGYVYRGRTGALPVGSYVYADYCTGEIFLWDGAQQQTLTDTSRNISSFGEDEDGELYVVGLGGTIDKIVGPVNRGANADFDGNGTTDLSIFRPGNGNWYIRNTLATLVQPWGLAGDLVASELYDNDSRTDIAVFRPSNGGRFFIIGSVDNSVNVIDFGGDGAVPVPGSYFGDNRAELAVWLPASGTWKFRSFDGTSGEITRDWGQTGDVPVQGDYDGDGYTDLAVWRPSNGTWYIRGFEDATIAVFQYGEAADVPTPGDYDGDGKNDLALFRPSTGQWFIRRSSGGFEVFNWGENGDIPVPGDYDGDGRTDAAVFRPSNGVWYIAVSSGGIIQSSPWGIAGDAPVPAYDLP